VKCKNCFARVHEDCLQRHNAMSDPSERVNLHPAGSASPAPSDDETNVICPICTGNYTPSTLRHYRLLEKSIEEERNLLRDWNLDECVACGDVGNLIVCDLCCCEPMEKVTLHSDQRRTRSQRRALSQNRLRFRKDTHRNFVTHDSKLDTAGQFHYKCVVLGQVSTPRPYSLINLNQAPDPFICPLCTTDFGSNRLQTLHFFQRKRMNKRELRMQEKAVKAQRFVQKTGIEVDEVKKCVFCRISSDDTAAGVFFDKENEFIGPFYDEAKSTNNRQRQSGKMIKYWAHYQCVMWAPQVYMDENNQFCMVEAEIKRSKHLSCCVCGKNGAVLGCYEKGCQFTYHFHCAQEEHCYFDKELFAIYCPSHYFNHFLASVTEGPTSHHRIEKHRVNGINETLFKKNRFNLAPIRNRKVASTKLCKPTDFCERYKSAAQVFEVMGRVGPDTVSAVSRQQSREPSINVANLPEPRTRHQKRVREQLLVEKQKQKKKRCRESLMAIGGRKRGRCMEGNLVTHTDELQLSPHERKRRRIFNLQPMTINDKTMDIEIKPDHIDLSELVDSDFDMSAMVGGLDEAVTVLKETVLLPLLYPELFSSFHLKPAKGVVLYGPPGTGKTLLVKSLIRYYYAMSKAVYSSSRSASPNSQGSPIRASSITVSTPSPRNSKNPNQRYRSLADAAQIDREEEQQQELQRNQSLISFFSRRGPDLLSKYHGETERNLRALFRKAEECSPSIIFFDEIDGMCPTRSMKNDQVHNSVVATLLSLMDGLHADSKAKERSSRVFVIAATNRIDNVDAALRRPGRFDREIYVGLPNANQRLKILRIHTKGWRTEFGSERDFHGFLKMLAVQETEGFSGADLKAFCNETMMNAIHRSCPRLMSSDGYDEGIASSLRDGVVIQTSDFKKTLDDGFKPSRARSGSGPQSRLDRVELERMGEHGHEELLRLLQRVDVYLRRWRHGDPGAVPSRAADVDLSDDEDEDVDMKGEAGGAYVRSVNQARMLCQSFDRIMIHGEDSRKRRVAVQTLLHQLDIANVQHVTFSALAACTVRREEIYREVMEKISLAITSGVGVLIFCDLDIALRHYPELMENVLLSNVSEMAREHTLLLVATARSWKSVDCWNNQWPQAVFELFGKDTFHVD